MKKQVVGLLLRILCATLFTGGFAHAQEEAEEEEPKAPPAASDAASQPPGEVQPFYVDPPLQPITEKEKKDACRNYEGKFITFYDAVYKIKGCKRFELTVDEIYEQSRLGTRLYEVEGRIIASLDSGGMLTKVTSKAKPCAEIEGRYVTVSFVDIYFIQNCKKRAFPEWASFEQRRGPFQLTKEGRPASSNVSIMQLNDDELAAIKTGEPFPSVVEKEYKDHLTFEKNIEIIPNDQACKGLIGRHVTYLDQIYVIESMSGLTKAGGFCQRRAVDAESFTKKHLGENLKLTELTSNQAVSIPLN